MRTQCYVNSVSTQDCLLKVALKVLETLAKMYLIRSHFYVTCIQWLCYLQHCQWGDFVCKCFMFGTLACQMAENGL